MRKAITILLSALLISVSLQAQTNGYVYGIDNASSGVFWFSKMETATGQFTHLNLMPWTMYSTNVSSCSDPDQQFYYYCDGTTMYKIAPATGVILSTVTIGISSSAELLHVAYNPCDSMIYGVVNDYPNNIYFASYDPLTGITSNLGNLSPMMMFCGGCMSFIDPVNQVYVLHSTSLFGISISTGQVVYSTSFVNLPNEQFGHISYDCKEGRIIGTSANWSEGMKYLSVIDPVTGIVSHITQNGWASGLWKPSNGGNSIDNSNSIYYYSGAPNYIIGVDMISGDTLTVQSTGGGSFLCLQYFSQCSCNADGIIEVDQSACTVYPNPVTDVLIVETEYAPNQMFEVTDASGRVVISSTLNNSRNFISVEALAPGIYFWSNKTTGSQGKFIRTGE